MRNVLQGFPCGRMMATLSSSEVKAIEQNCQDLCVSVLWAILDPPSHQLYKEGKLIGYNCPRKFQGEIPVVKRPSILLGQWLF